MPCGVSSIPASGHARAQAFRSMSEVSAHPRVSAPGAFNTSRKRRVAAPSNSVTTDSFTLATGAKRFCAGRGRGSPGPSPRTAIACVQTRSVHSYYFPTWIPHYLSVSVGGPRRPRRADVNPISVEGSTLVKRLCGGEPKVGRSRFHYCRSGQPAVAAVLFCHRHSAHPRWLTIAVFDVSCRPATLLKIGLSVRLHLDQLRARDIGPLSTVGFTKFQPRAALPLRCRSRHPPAFRSRVSEKARVAS